MKFAPLALRWSFARLGLTLVLGLAVGGCGDAGPSPSLGQTEAPITYSPDLFPNDQAAFNYFVGKGLTSFQSAGIVGNLDQESGVDPNAVQSGGPGRGIAQWSVGGRWDTDANDNATAYASQQGQSVLSLGLQLDFIWYELTTFSGYGLAALRATTDVTNATITFQTDFEGCGQCVQSQRIAYAQAVLAAYGAVAYSAAYVSQSFPLASAPPLAMVEGQVIPSYIELKNTGTKTWDSNTRIGTTQPRDRKSAFADGTWINDTRPAAVTGTVPPGGTYKFQFDLAAPVMPGTYDEFFGVVQEGVAWFSDPGQGGPPDNDLEVKITVTAPQYRGTFKDQSFPLSPAPITVHEGDVVTGYFELTNSGSQTWKAGTTKLAPIPRDKSSPFADASWLSPTRVSTVAADVAPGAVGRFDVTLATSALGDTEIGFGLVEENVTWFADPAGGGPADGFLKVHLVVVPTGAPLDAGVPSAGDGGAVVLGGDGGPGPSGNPGGDAGMASWNAATGTSGGCTMAPAQGGGSAPATPPSLGLGVLVGLAFVRRRARG